MIESKSMASRITDLLIMVALSAAAFACILPLINSIAISFSTKSMVAAGEVFLWPVQFTLSSYKEILGDSSFLVAFGVSIKRVILGGSLNFLLTVLMAYPLSKEKAMFRHRHIYMWIIIFTMLFNGGLIPWYMTIKSLGLIDSIWALVLPGAVPVFNVILLMNFFRGIPKELDEAALVDGSGPWQTLFRIYLPISKPALATITLFSIVGHWNSFFDGLILMNKPIHYPLQTYIQQLVVQINIQNLSVEDIKRFNELSNKTLNAAKITISMLPILIIYPFLQRFFIHGIVLGSVKE